MTLKTPVWVQGRPAEPHLLTKAGGLWKPLRPPSALTTSCPLSGGQRVFGQNQDDNSAQAPGLPEGWVGQWPPDFEVNTVTVRPGAQ